MVMPSIWARVRTIDADGLRDPLSYMAIVDRPSPAWSASHCWLAPMWSRLSARFMDQESVTRCDRMQVGAKVSARLSPNVTIALQGLVTRRDSCMIVES